MNLGKKILELRKKKGLSQEQLGEEINVTRQTISNWELGETTPNSEQLIEIADIFEISVDELIGHKIKYRKNNKREIVLYLIIGVLSIVSIASISLLLNNSKEPVNENPIEKSTIIASTSRPTVNDTFIRTYKVLKLEKVDCNGKTGCDETTYKIKLEQCKKDIEEIQVTNIKGIKDLEVGKTYEFTFEPQLGEVYYEDEIKNIFAFNKVKSIKETNKSCSKQTQDDIKTRSN